MTSKTAHTSDRLVEIDIDALDLVGDGVARVGRRSIAVPFTIPGERVLAALHPRPRADGVVPAAVVEILRASPHRIEPRCPHFGPQPAPLEPCGGCTWQHIAYDEQRRLKTALVTRLVRAAVPAAPEAAAMLPSTPAGEPWGYRHKVHFVFAAASVKGGLTMGHYARGSRRVVQVRECPVHAEDGNVRAFALVKAFARSGVLADGAGRSVRGPKPGVLKSVTVRVARSTRERMVTLVVSGDDDRRLRTATRRALEDAGDETSLHVNLHPRQDAFVFGRETRRVRGPERLRDNLAGASFLISPTSFFQNNVDAAEHLVALVLDAVPAGGAVLDLYAGAGLFAIPLALAGRTVVAVEENRAAVADGEASRALNRLPQERCRWIAGSVEAVLARAPAADTVILDPPRDGCSEPVRRAVFVDRRPSLVVYVSCNPETLARDLGAASKAGYAIEGLQPVDMFPHTPHVETVAVLRRQSR